jgi:hypothetical protein
MVPSKSGGMNDQLVSNTTVSFLESGRMLARVSNAAAVVAGVGSVIVHSAIRLLFAGSMLCWLVEVWFAVRVHIDASLFRQLAGESESSWKRLDELLTSYGYHRPSENCSVSDRASRAMALWRHQVATLAIQLASLAIALLCEVTGI